MTGPDAAAVVAELGRRFRAGDRDGARALLHPDLRIEQPASLPHGGSHRGPEGMAAMGASFAEHWDRTIGLAEVLACGDAAVQITTQTWTAKATGRSATVDVVELFRIVGGLVVEIRVFQQDTHALLATLDRPFGEAPDVVRTATAAMGEPAVDLDRALQVAAELDDELIRKARDEP